jgi:hypothetical protein
MDTHTHATALEVDKRAVRRGICHHCGTGGLKSATSVRRRVICPFCGLKSVVTAETKHSPEEILGFSYLSFRPSPINGDETFPGTISDRRSSQKTLHGDGFVVEEEEEEEEESTEEILGSSFMVELPANPVFGIAPTFLGSEGCSNDTTSVDTDESHVGFMDLPAELRIKIYKYYCIAIYNSYVLPRWWRRRYGPPPLDGELVICWPEIFMPTQRQLRAQGMTFHLQVFRGLEKAAARTWKAYRKAFVNFQLVSKQVRMEFLPVWAELSTFEIVPRCFTRAKRGRN